MVWKKKSCGAHNVNGKKLVADSGTEKKQNRRRFM